MWSRCAAVVFSMLLPLALGQRILDASGIAANCMLSGTLVSFNVLDPAIVLADNEEWWKATVVAINRDPSAGAANWSTSSAIPKSYRIKWCSEIPPGSSSEVNVTVSKIRKNDIVDCFALRGECKKYKAGDRGTFCACGWTQDGGNVCAKDANWDSGELSQVSCGSAAQLPLKSESERMIAQQGKSFISCSQLAQQSCSSTIIDLTAIVSTPRQPLRPAQNPHLSLPHPRCHPSLPNTPSHPAARGRPWAA